MTSRDSGRTLSQEKALFTRSLENAIELGAIPQSNGLEPYVFDALVEVAESYPTINPDLVRKAKGEWAFYEVWARSR